MKYMRTMDGFSTLIREKGKGATLERYDKSKKQWVKDNSLSDIYVGGTAVEYISKTKADNLIKKK